MDVYLRFPQNETYLIEHFHEQYPWAGVSYVIKTPDANTQEGINKYLNSHTLFRQITVSLIKMNM